jgi:hypothetical protein
LSLKLEREGNSVTISRTDGAGLYTRAQQTIRNVLPSAVTVEVVQTTGVMKVRWNPPRTEAAAADVRELLLRLSDELRKAGYQLVFTTRHADIETWLKG